MKEQGRHEHEARHVLVGARRKKMLKLKAARKHGKCLCHWVSLYDVHFGIAPCLSSKQLRETDQARHALLQTPVQEPHGADRGSDSICSSRHGLFSRMKFGNLATVAFSFLFSN